MAITIDSHDHLWQYSADDYPGLVFPCFKSMSLASVQLADQPVPRGVFLDPERLLIGAVGASPSSAHSRAGARPPPGSRPRTRKPGAPAPVGATATAGSAQRSPPSGRFASTVIRDVAFPCEPSVALRASVRRHRSAQGVSPMLRAIRPMRASYRDLAPRSRPGGVGESLRRWLSAG
jgi:hypothetical protein